MVFIVLRACSASGERVLAAVAGRAPAPFCGIVATRRPKSHAVAPRSVSSSVTLPPFQRLLDDHGRDVHRFLIATVGRDGADDCYQEACLSALRAYPGLRDASNLRSWLLTIGHHKAIDHLRARRRQAIPMDELPEPAPAPAQESDDGIWDAVGALPSKQRTALALRY